MGDRTSVWIRIGGQVKDVDALADALINEGMGHDYSIKRVTDVVVDALRAAAGNPDGAEFTADEVNYGNCDALEAECRRQGLAYEFHWHAGSGYGEGGHIFKPDGDFVEYSGEGGDNTITVHLLSLLRTDAGVHPVIAAIQDARENTDGER